jgi:Peptidase A4 family
LDLHSGVRDSLADDGVKSPPERRCLGVYWAKPDRVLSGIDSEENSLLSKRLCIVAGVCVMAVALQFPNSPSSPRKAEHPKWPRHHDINRLVSQREDGTSTSTNWSGYAVTGTGFTAVGGSWIVPAVTCKSGSQYGSFWVGIDGYNSQTVEQLGTESDCSGKTASYHAWYEFCCIEPEITIPSMPVKPGDVMSAAVSYNGTNFTLSMKDHTTGKTFSKTGNISGAQRTSAEWIAEAPSSFGILPLSDFGTMLFGNDNTGIAKTCSAAMGSTGGPIGSFTNFFQITMVDSSNNPKAIPTILSSDGTSFSDTWVASQ